MSGNPRPATVETGRQESRRLSGEPRLQLVLTGTVREYADPGGGTFRSAIHKQPVAGPVLLGPGGLAGDEQAATRVHGGPEKALLAYPAAAYEDWNAEDDSGLEPLMPGAFGENLLVEGLDEGRVCIGDTWAVLREGRLEPVALLQVTQPRVPCATPGRRWGRPELQARMGDSARIGWYLRVLQPGTLAAGDRLERIQRTNPTWSVLRAWRMASDKARDPASWAELLALSELSADWR
jgi:MOSC domain-containing protein YiiM